MVAARVQKKDPPGVVRNGFYTTDTPKTVPGKSVDLWRNPAAMQGFIGTCRGNINMSA